MTGRRKSSAHAPQALVEALKPHIGFTTPGSPRVSKPDRSRLEAWPLRGQGCALALRRSGDERLGGAAEAFAAVLDEHFGRRAPLLTAERREALRRAWGAGRKAAAEAHGVLFTAVERKEYSLELFLEDLQGCEELSLLEAEEFLARNQ